MEINEKVLQELMGKDFPEDSVELGENWQFIAQVFYMRGLLDGINNPNQGKVEVIWS